MSVLSQFCCALMHERLQERRIDGLHFVRICSETPMRPLAVWA